MLCHMFKGITVHMIRCLIRFSSIMHLNIDNFLILENMPLFDKMFDKTLINHASQHRQLFDPRKCAPISFSVA